jgi:membrane-bound ClpP family serine protease
LALDDRHHETRTSMDPILWAALLFLLGLVLVCAEVFLPSGGLLGFMSISALIAGIFIAFYHRGAEVGLIFLLLTILAVPAALSVAFRYWPQTPMGRRLLLQAPRADEVLPDSPYRQRLRQLVGQFGVAKSVMMPSGAVLVDGEQIDALSEGQYIEAGQPIQIIQVQGNRVIVRAVDESESRVASGDVLSQPIESLGIEGLEEPLS